MKVLITGITGFVGSHLAEYLLKEGHEVYGISRWRSKMDNVEHIIRDIHLINADIRDGYSMAGAFKSVLPDYCFHLAAQSFVLESWKSPVETMTTNVIGTVNVLEAARLVIDKCRVVVAGSSEEYGLVHLGETPIKEENPLRPMSPYGVSKVATDKLGILYYMSYQAQVIVTRMFNTTGPRRGDVFATSNFAKQIVEIEMGKKEPVLFVGNLDAQRDFCDVRDMAKAYWYAVSKGQEGEVYNVCSGRTITIKKMLDKLLAMSNIDIKIEQDPDRMRPSDVPVLLGSSDKFRQKTGWKPEIPFGETLFDLLNYWRAKI